MIERRSITATLAFYILYLFCSFFKKTTNSIKHSHRYEKTPGPSLIHLHNLEIDLLTMSDSDHNERHHLIFDAAYHSNIIAYVWRQAHTKWSLAALYRRRGCLDS